MSEHRSDAEMLSAMGRALRDQIDQRRRECRHNGAVVVVCSWRPWRGYKVHEECVSCGATLDHPGHWWRRANMMKRYRHLQALNAAEQQRHIDTLGSEQ